jgi:hypothetical protein
MTGISRSQIFRLYLKVRERRWDPSINMRLEDRHLEDAERSDRPPISMEARAYIIKVITKNAITRGYSYKRII